MMQLDTPASLPSRFAVYCKDSIITLVFKKNYAPPSVGGSITDCTRLSFRLVHDLTRTRIKVLDSPKVT